MLPRAVTHVAAWTPDCNKILGPSSGKVGSTIRTRLSTCRNQNRSISAWWRPPFFWRIATPWHRRRKRCSWAGVKDLPRAYRMCVPACDTFAITRMFQSVVSRQLPSLLVFMVLFPMACATTYEPARQRPPVEASGTSASIIAIVHGVAVIGYHSDSSVTFGRPRVSTTSAPPCQSGRGADWDVLPRAPEADSAFIEREGDGQLRVRLMGTHAWDDHGNALDLNIRTGHSEECLRLPLTPKDDEVLWVANPPYAQVGVGIRVDLPYRYGGGLGPGLTLEPRFMRKFGSWVGMWAVGLGWAVCANDCPPNWSLSLFGHLETSANLIRRFEFTHTALETGAGLGLQGSLLLVNKSYQGNRGEFFWGPFLAARLLFFSREIPGFSPPHRNSSGPEISLTRRFVYGRLPTGQDTVVSLGWCWQFSN